MIKLTAIPQLYRNVNRSYEILAVLSKYGLADWICRLDIGFAKELFKAPAGEAIARISHEARIRMALTELGPTFIKFGQILSTRADLVGVELAHELQKLQADLPADAPAIVRRTVETELGCPLEDVFVEFNPVACASASIGQVHRARLKTGEPVAVKVRHAAIQDKIRVDLEIMAGLAQLSERIPEFQIYRPRATVAEFQRMLRRELDFSREERHMRQFAEDFCTDTTVRIPRSYPALSTSRVLTMEYLDGTKLADLRGDTALGSDAVEIARRGARMYLKMIFVHGYYHADPHPGNFVLLPQNVIGLLDYGMVSRIDEQLRDDIEEMLLAIAGRDPEWLTSIIIRVGSVPPHLDEAALAIDVADFVAFYSHQRLDDFDLSGALNEMVEMIRRYQITLPARVAMLIKVLVMLEGTSRLADPQFNLVELMQPFHKRMMVRRMSPRRHLRKARRLYGELEQLAKVLPRGIMDILKQVQTGRFHVHLDHRGLEPSVNRLVLGLLSSAMFMGSSLLLSFKVGPLIHLPPLAPEMSVLGAIGCTGAIMLGVRLLFAINKSGHLDERR